MEKSAKKLEKRALASGVDLKLSKSDVLAYDVSASDEDGKCTPESRLLRVPFQRAGSSCKGSFYH